MKGGGGRRREREGKIKITRREREAEPEGEGRRTLTRCYYSSARRGPERPRASCALRSLLSQVKKGGGDWEVRGGAQKTPLRPFEKRANRMIVLSKN